MNKVATLGVVLFLKKVTKAAGKFRLIYSMCLCTCDNPSQIQGMSS